MFGNFNLTFLILNMTDAWMRIMFSSHISPLKEAFVDDTFTRHQCVVCPITNITPLTHCRENHILWCHNHFIKQDCLQKQKHACVIHIQGSTVACNHVLILLTKLTFPLRAQTHKSQNSRPSRWMVAIKRVKYEKHEEEFWHHACNSSYQGNYTVESTLVMADGDKSASHFWYTDKRANLLTTRPLSQSTNIINLELNVLVYTAMVIWDFLPSRGQ